MSPTPPAKLFWLVLLLLFWAFYGQLGRDAWKAEEALALTPILDWHAGLISAWSTPAPLYTLVTGVVIKLNIASGDIQGAARLASGLFTCIALLFTGLSGRALFGPGFGPAASIALVGGFGLMLRAHALLPETALLAVWSLLLYGVTAARGQPVRAAWSLAVALALLMLGLRGPLDLVAGLTIALLPLFLPAWSDHRYRQSILRGVFLAAGLIAVGLLYLLITKNFGAWEQWHGLGQFSSLRHPSRAFSELPWFAWPLWPLALGAIWHAHRRLTRTPELHIPMLAVVVLMVAALAPAWSRDGALLPVLLPLALLSAYGLENLRRGAAQAFYWFGVLFFACFVAALWIYFVAIEWGFPIKVARHMANLSPNYTHASLGGVSYVVAVGATLIWVIAIPLFPRAKKRPILVWATGMILVWILIASLFRPWAESGWGYRPLIADLARQLPPGSCLNAEVDPAMQTMLRVHLNAPAQADCPWKLRQFERSSPQARLVPADNVVWQGFRPRQKAQIFQLERYGFDQR